MKTIAELKKENLQFEDVCKIKGDKPEDIRPYASPINARQQAANDRAELDYVAEYLQDGFVADYGNRNQEKWFPVFIWDKTKSAFVFAYSLCGYPGTVTTVGSRLSFPTEEMSDFYGTQFLPTHDRLLANKY